MPLEHGSSEATISRNIGELVSAGHDQDQAAAIAYHEAGKATLYADPDNQQLNIGTPEQVADAITALGPGFRGHRVSLEPGKRSSVINNISKRIGELDISDDEKTHLRERLSKVKTEVVPIEFWTGSTIKALGDGKVGGYLVVFGGPADAQGEWFSPGCDFHLNWFGDTATRPILYHHGLKDEDMIEEIGYLTSLVTDGHGLYAEGQLDMGNPRAQAVYSEINKGRIGWSSGSAPHLSKVTSDGCIIEWAIVEASLTPTPAAGRRTTVQALKFDTSTFEPNDALIEPAVARASNVVKEAYANKGNKENRRTKRKGKPIMTIKGMPGLIGAMQGANIDADAIIAVLQALEEGEGVGGDNSEMMADTDTGSTPEETATMSADPAKDAGPVTEGDNVTISDSGSKPAMTPPAQGKPGTGATNVAGKVAQTAGANGAVMAQLLQMVLDSKKTAPASSKAAGFQGPNPARQTVISGMKTQYHDLDAGDMAFLYEMRRQGKNPRHMGIEFEREMAAKAMKAYSANALRLEPEVARKVAMKVEFNNTGNAADGGNWVPDLWSSILWMRVRIDNNVAKNVEVFQMPSPTFEYPIESTDPTVYAVGESDTDAEQTLATNVFTRSKLTVSKLQFVSKKTGLQVGFSTEIEEDSIIPFIPQLRAQSVRAFANSIDNNLLNSDSVTGTGNINYKGANTSAVPTANFLFGGGDGMRKNALVTNTNVAYNFQGGIPTLAGIRLTRFKMLSATNTYGINPEDLVIITDPYTYGKFLAIDEINVYMNNGRNATVNTGVVPAIDGTEVYASAELALADNTGYALSSGAGTLGNFVIFARPAWKVGYVRQVMTDVSYVPWNDSYILTMTARYAIGKKDTVASAVGYNILVNS